VVVLRGLRSVRRVPLLDDDIDSCRPVLDVSSDLDIVELTTMVVWMGVSRRRYVPSVIDRMVVQGSVLPP